jgi:hypothetical protein
MIDLSCFVEGSFQWLPRSASHRLQVGSALYRPTLGHDLDNPTDSPCASVVALPSSGEPKAVWVTVAQGASEKELLRQDIQVRQELVEHGLPCTKHIATC